jgi:hypothetical protein
MGSIPELEALLKRCEFIVREHKETAEQLRPLPDYDFKREMLATFENSFCTALDAQQKTREALNRERAKLN